MSTKTVTIKVKLTKAQYQLLRNYASALGLSDAYALRMAALRDLLDWDVKVTKQQAIKKEPKG